MRMDGSHRSTKQFRRGVLELIALGGRTPSKWSVTVEKFTLSPRPGHLKVNVVHDVGFRRPRPAFVWGNEAIDSRQEESPFGLVEKARGSLGPWSREHRGGLSCQRRSRNRDQACL